MYEMGYCLEKELGFDQYICMGSVGGTSSMVCAVPPCYERLERSYPTVQSPELLQWY